MLYWFLTNQSPKSIGAPTKVKLNIIEINTCYHNQEGIRVDHNTLQEHQKFLTEMEILQISDLLK